MWNLGEAGFKRRLEAAHPHVRARFSDSLGHKLRSSKEVRIAELLIRSNIRFEYEPRLEARGHAFYPDFALNNNRVIEVVGYAGDRYWDRTARKLALLVSEYDSMQVAVVTSYGRIIERRIEGLPRISVFTLYQEAELVRWCRGLPGFTVDRKQSGLMRGP